MTIFKRLKPLLVLVILTTLVGCRLQVSAPIGGDVTWGDGEDDACSAGEICVIPINDADFNLTFTATAAVGYEFQGWEFRLRNDTDPLTPIPVQCSNTDEDNNVCELSLLPFLLDDVEVLLESRSQGYLTPIYKILFTDTDGDGVFDADDFYPLFSLGDLVDTDGDGIPDDCDVACVALGMAADDDDDGDGVLDGPDAFPQDASESQDADGDGVGDNADLCENTAAGTAVDTDGCTVVVVAQAIPPGAMASTGTYTRLFSIPGQGKILAQSFTVPGDAGDADGDGVGQDINSYGKFVFHTIPGDAFTPAINIWVSDAPGGEAISPQCYLENGLKASELLYAAPIDVGLSWWCGLNPNQSYYLNVVHANAQDPSSNIRRSVKVAQILNDDQCPNTPAGATVDADGCP